MHTRWMNNPQQKNREGWQIQPEIHNEQIGSGFGRVVLWLDAEVGLHIFYFFVYSCKKHTNNGFEDITLEFSEPSGQDNVKPRIF